MKWLLPFGEMLACLFSPKKLVDLAMKVWPQVWKKIPPLQRVDFLKSVAEKHLGAFLEDLSREERTTLMNALLPLAACEFPLINLDFLSAFSSPGEGYQTETSD